MSRILIHSNAPWVPSGYGRQTKLLLPLLAGEGHDVAVSAFSGLSGAPIQWGGHWIFPAGLEPFSPDVVAGHAGQFKADLVIFLMDFWKMAPVAGELRTLRTAAWLPTDCYPLGSPDRNTLERSGAVPLALSRFAMSTLEAAGFSPLYVPHAVDTSIFRPAPDRDAMREALGLKGRFTVGICAANQDGLRKGWPEQLQAFAEFHRRHDDSVLLLHTLASHPKGLPLAQMVSEYGLDGAVLWSDQYAQAAGLMDDDTMAGWFQCLDVLMACSYAEAFGIPIIEAQACGTPVITTNGSAMAELAGPGWTVSGEPFWNPVHLANWTRPSIKGIVSALNKAYSASPTSSAARRKNAAKFASPFDHRAVFDRCWRPALQVIEGLTPPPLITEFDGFRWNMGNMRNRCGDLLALNHEADLEPVIRGLLPAGSKGSAVFVDIGAHVGHWAVRLAGECDSVYAIEADPNTADALMANLELNNITNVEVWPIAAWSSETDLMMFSPNQYDHDGSTQVRATGTGDRAIRGYPLDLPRFLGGLARIDLIKLDVEGADLEVLRGMRETLARTRPVLFIEDHSVYGFYAREDLNALLTELGYGWDDLDLYKGYLIARPRVFSR